jgi:hypothetical protein
MKTAQQTNVPSSTKPAPKPQPQETQTRTLSLMPLEQRIAPWWY